MFVENVQLHQTGSGSDSGPNILFPHPFTTEHPLFHKFDFLTGTNHKIMTEKCDRKSKHNELIHKKRTVWSRGFKFLKPERRHEDPQTDEADDRTSSVLYFYVINVIMDQTSWFFFCSDTNMRLILKRFDWFRKIRHHFPPHYSWSPSNLTRTSSHDSLLMKLLSLEFLCVSS